MLLGLMSHFSGSTELLLTTALLRVMKPLPSVPKFLLPYKPSAPPGLPLAFVSLSTPIHHSHLVHTPSLSHPGLPCDFLSYHLLHRSSG